MKFLSKIDKLIQEELNLIPWTNVYGLGRSLMALSTLTIFLLNDYQLVFRPNMGQTEVPICSGKFSGLSLFCMLSQHLEMARWIACFVLILVVIGWRPRFTGILHWWINFSLITSAPLIDGGEHATTIVSFFLIPLTLTDHRKWHWQNSLDINSQSLLFKMRHLTAIFSYQLVRIQIAVIYLHAAYGKCSVEEWINGTAVYYWFTDPVFGAPDYLMPLIKLIITNPYGVVAVTWGTIIFEFFLFAALFMSRRWKNVMLPLGILFHIAIGLIHGLATFSLVMIGILIIYLRPLDMEYFLVGGRFKGRMKREESIIPSIKLINSDDK